VSATPNPPARNPDRRHFLRAALAAALGPGAVASMRGDDRPSPGSFEVVSTGDAVPTGTLEKLAADWTVSLQGATPARVPGDELIVLRRRATPPPAWPAGEHIVCANGDRIPGHVTRLRDERVRLAAEVGGKAELSFAVTAVSFLWLATPEGLEDVEAYQLRLARERRARDVVVLRNGDTVEGTLSTLDERTLRLEADGKGIDVERDRVGVVAFNSELTRAARPRSAYGRVTLANGGRLSLASAQADRTRLTGKTLAGAAVAIPLEQLVSLERRGGAAVYLSDLKPLRYEHRPYLGVSWPWTADAGVAGRALHLAGGTYDKGLGLHSESRLTFDLKPGYRRFECLVGLDERTGRDGDVQLQVLLDGKPQRLGWDGTLNGRDAPHPVRVATTGARALTLAVGFGRRGDVQDHVDWADARLVR
jgi:NPCBM/NEW2 domain